MGDWEEKKISIIMNCKKILFDEWYLSRKKWGSINIFDVITSKIVYLCNADGEGVESILGATHRNWGRAGSL